MKMEKIKKFQLINSSTIVVKLQAKSCVGFYFVFPLSQQEQQEQEQEEQEPSPKPIQRGCTRSLKFDS